MGLYEVANNLNKLFLKNLSIKHLHRQDAYATTNAPRHPQLAHIKLPVCCYLSNMTIPDKSSNQITHFNTKARQ